jgi:hypothetical protein
MERSFFEQVLDVFEGVVADIPGALHHSVHGRGLKVWFDDSTREHYEAQLVRVDGETALEIGFHAEHAKPAVSEAALARLVAKERTWRKALGTEPEAGLFIGTDRWRRISEVWAGPDLEDTAYAIDVAVRLADYVQALEPVRRVVGP